jgi:hypothetical protein
LDGTEVVLGRQLMFGALSRAIDRFRGSGDAAITVPPMDGAFSPNQRLDDASSVLEINAPDNLATDGQRVWFSSDGDLFELKPGELSSAAEHIAQFESSITCMDARPDAGIAVGLAGGGLFFRNGPYHGKKMLALEGRRISCPTALHFEDANTVVLCLGSQNNDPTQWKRDLLERNASGSVWRIDLQRERCTLLADNLAWPNGLAKTRDRLIVAESWRHRLAEINAGRLNPILTELPGYPGRISAASPAGFWLVIPTPRLQLIEFVLREPRFRRAMMKEMEPDFWVAPSLDPITDHREPLQAGAMRELGEIKPWAPSRSYGLVVRLDAEFRPRQSFHSRANGRRHGITSCCEVGARLLLTSHGAMALLSLDVNRQIEA